MIKYDIPQMFCISIWRIDKITILCRTASGTLNLLIDCYLYRVCWLKMILFWQNGLLTCASAQVKTLWYVMNKYEILGVVGEGQFD